MRAFIFGACIQPILCIVFLANNDWSLIGSTMTYELNETGFTTGSAPPIIWHVQSEIAPTYCVYIPRSVPLRCNGVFDNAGLVGGMDETEWAARAAAFPWRFNAPLTLLNCSVHNTAFPLQVGGTGIPLVVPCIDLGSPVPQIRITDHVTTAVVIATCSYILMAGVFVVATRSRRPAPKLHLS